MRTFLLRWGCNIGELLSQFNKPDFGSLPISIIGIEIIAEGFDLRLDLEEFIRCHFDNIVLQELLFPELSLLDLPGFLKIPFFFTYEGIEHVTLARSDVQIRQRSVRVLVP